MAKRKILFIDRDGTLIAEPADEQIDSVDKFALQANVILALLQLQQAGYELVMVTNQDGLGTEKYPIEKFDIIQKLLLDIFSSQGITFKNILICPHFSHANCDCRKPKLGLLIDYLRNDNIDFNNSYVIGDRQTDIELAKNLKISAIHFGPKNWAMIAAELIQKPRQAKVTRKTNETNIEVTVNLDQIQPLKIATGLGFFDHMLEQLAKHGGFALQLSVSGDLQIDEHHTVEDTGLALGQALRQALGDKLGIARYGFLLPMDEALAQVALDFSGRPYFQFAGKFQREKVGDLPTELVPHFFRSLTESLAATLNIKVEGENEHHKIESIFKGVGRALRMAVRKEGYDLPTTKGIL